MSSAHRRPRRRSRAPTQWTVTTELVDPLPITKEELDAIERHFDGILELCLKGKIQTDSAEGDIKSPNRISHFAGQRILNEVG